jgi:hypothetical protein
MTNNKTKKSLYDVFRKQASKAFNYPSVKLCSNGDVCIYLKQIKL